MMKKETSKPRNLVVKNAIRYSVAHVEEDRKKSSKRGKFKHKKEQFE